VEGKSNAGRVLGVCASVLVWAITLVSVGAAAASAHDKHPHRLALGSSARWHTPRSLFFQAGLIIGWGYIFGNSTAGPGAQCLNVWLSFPAIWTFLAAFGPLPRLLPMQSEAVAGRAIELNRSLCCLGIIDGRQPGNVLAPRFNWLLRPLNWER